MFNSLVISLHLGSKNEDGLYGSDGGVEVNNWFYSAEKISASSQRESLHRYVCKFMNCLKSSHLLTGSTIH